MEEERDGVMKAEIRGHARLIHVPIHTYVVHVHM